jgi:hypothetical protein
LLNFYFAEITLLDTRALAVHSHQDIVDLVTFVRERCEKSVNAIRDDLSHDLIALLGRTSDGASAVVDLTFKISFMVSPEQIPKTDISIKDAIFRSFPKTEATPVLDKFDTNFEADSLRQLGGIEIVRTNTLSDHLLLDEHKCRLSLFAHEDFLQFHLNSRFVWPMSS